MVGLLTVTVVVALSALILGVHITRTESHLVEHVDRQVKHLERFTMSAAQDALNAAVAQVRKGTQEVVAKIADLQAQVDAGVPSEELDLSGLAEAAQALDDIVPDVPAEVPADEPPAEVVGDPVDTPADA